MAFIQLDNIRKSYFAGEDLLPVLKGISFTVSRGEFVSLMGASGSGKSTLMNIMGCLDHPTSGSYSLDGIEVSAASEDLRAEIRNQKIGFVFQNFNLLARTSALDNVLMPLAYSPKPPPELEQRRRALKLLHEFGLGHRVRHEPSKLSGGQQQRVAIARSLINDPVLLFADEPTGNLDSETSREVLKIFQELNEKGLTIILVTHDRSVARFAGRIMRIHDGELQEATSTDDISQI